MSIQIFPDDIAVGQDAIGISAVEHLASYNWIDCVTPTILVPGSPNLWTPPRQQRRLNKDSGLTLIAQNAYRMPKRPIEPLFRALFVQRPHFELHGVDLVTDRNNLRKLLSFVQNKGTESFTIRLERIQNTLIMNRDEAKKFEIIGSSEFRGFNHEFEKAYTKNKFSKSTGHYRIITYKLGGLKIILRHETDGYQKDDNLEDLLQSLSLVTAKDPLTFDGSNLVVQKQGEEVPLSSTLAIKTRVFHKPIVFEDIAAQLWLSQTPNLVRAYYQRGIFDPCKVENVKAEIDTWEREHRKDISKLGHLLCKIQALVQTTGVNILRFDDLRGCLTLTTAEQPKMLTADLYAKWAEQTPEEPATDEPVLGVEAVVVVDGVEHDIDISDIPYLRSLARSDGKIIHGKIEYFDIAIKGLQSGYRQCFQKMDPAIQDHIKLIETYKLLQIEVLGGSTQNDIVKKLKLQADYDDASDSKAIQQDAAYQLLFIMHETRSFTEDTAVLNNLFAAVFYIVSHPRTFGNRSRIVIKMAYSAWFEPTIKQQAQLLKWKKFWDPDLCDNGEEGDTDDEDRGYYYDYGSDSS